MVSKCKNACNKTSIGQKLVNVAPWLFSEEHNNNDRFCHFDVFVRP